ncbi:co-chaperone HscB [Aliivibrio fischeri]|uniref:co-chaperone HscB n=1 Tax=Aliivibrio fischeri TaxID=668 RepID=UPI0012DA827A|nr:co-chaperone HscB [Aliivibrio fischeri]MUL11740.1 co-chaperone HscB [Aliivibrio fischeri]MUL13710.1 co-chaperone HscB [Aliivibrio fischeri]
MNHFELFGLPNQFELDGGLLSLQFRELQKRFHPDNFATSSERDRLLSIQKAAQINDAYQTLKNPVSRAEYILSEQGHDIRGEQTTMQNPMFLMQQMELREELESLPASSDPESALFDFAENVTAMRKSQLVQLQELLKNEAWIEAAQSVRKLKFIEKLNQEVEQLEEKLLG